MKTKALTLIIVVMGLVFSATNVALAQWTWKKKTPAAEKTPTAAPAGKAETPMPTEQAAGSAAVSSESQPSASAAAPVPAMSKAELDRLRSIREKKKNELKNTQWDIEIMPLSGKGDKTKDVLIFKETKFSSEGLTGRGFKESNYSVSVVDNGIVVETMQSGAKEGIAFWRLEFDSGLLQCKGILSRQMGENKTEDFSFVSLGKKPYIPVPEPVAAVAQEAPALAQEVSAAPQQVEPPAETEAMPKA